MFTKLKGRQFDKTTRQGEYTQDTHTFPHFCLHVFTPQSTSRVSSISSSSKP
uniref:Uncharacterized protein n=1 Tax=Anguilla anguilla TaxID=7936 RepID=A0A0E9Q6T5_ANGAN